MTYCNPWISRTNLGKLLPWTSLSNCPVGSHGYDSIWVVVDRLSRAAHFVPILESIDSLELARLFLDRIFRHHGFPDSIVTKFYTQLINLCGTKMKPSTAYHPNGWINGTDKSGIGGLPTGLHLEATRRLGRLPCTGRIRMEQRTEFLYALYGYHSSFEPRLSDQKTY
jgi:hypothetical protein